MNRLIILDGNHIAYRAYYKFSRLKDLDGNNTSIVFGVPYIIESVIRRLSPNRVLLTFDGGRSKFRLGLLPGYKDREKKLGFDADDFFRQKDSARDLIMALGIGVVWEKGFEADDLIAMIARRYSKKCWETIIVSGDKDFDQLIKPNIPGISGPIKIHNVSKKVTLDYDNLFDITGYTPEQCVDYLSLLGDASDKIPGYPGIGKKRAPEFIEKFGSIKRFLNSDEGFGKLDRGKLKELYTLNRKLIDLNYFYRKFLIHKQIPIIGGDSFDEKAFKKYCAIYETNSFLKPQFINTFKKLHNEK